MHCSRSVLSTRRNRDTFLPIRLERTTLRLLRARDASSLEWVFHDEVQQHLPHAPQTPAHLARYTAWAERQSGVARQLGLAVTVGGRTIGIIQGWALEPTGRTIEWGFALARPRWGHGLFQESGRAFIAFAVQHLGVERIEARTALANDRAIAALRRLGARCEGVIPRGLADKRTDCFLWSILAADFDGRTDKAQSISCDPNHVGAYHDKPTGPVPVGRALISAATWLRG